MIPYFAYGSNLHPLRLIERVPSARLVGVSELRNYRLIFHKKSQDGSSKCNVIHTGCELDLVYGAIYEMEQAQKRVLDRVEGKGRGYLDAHLTLQYQGKEYGCFTFLAQPSYIVGHLKPYHWYKQLVVLGAKYLHFPDSYICSIDEIDSVEDQDETRRIENQTLIQKIIDYFM